MIESNTDPLDQIDPLPRGALRHEVVRRLMLAIFLGELPAGTRLVAKRLADRFGVSATPIREALVELEQIGVVQLLHNRGAQVRPFGREQVRDIFHVRQILESEATRCACGRIDGEELQGMREALCSLLAAPTDADGAWFQQVASSDRRFHEAIATHCGNARLMDELHRYHDLAETFREIVGNNRPAHQEALEAHLPIFDALLADKADEAGAGMRRHMETVGRLVEAAVFPGKPD